MYQICVVFITLLCLLHTAVAEVALQSPDATHLAPAVVVTILTPYPPEASREFARVLGVTCYQWLVTSPRLSPAHAHEQPPAIAKEDQIVRVLERIQQRLKPQHLTRALSYVRKSLDPTGIDTRLLDTVVRNFLVPSTSLLHHHTHQDTALPQTIVVDSGSPRHAPALVHPSIPVIIHDKPFGEDLGLLALEQIRSSFLTEGHLKPGVFGKFGVDPRVRGDLFSYITTDSVTSNPLKLADLTQVHRESPIGRILQSMLKFAANHLRPGGAHHQTICPETVQAQVPRPVHCQQTFSRSHVEAMLTSYPRNGSIHTLHSDDLYVGSFGKHPRILTMLYYLTNPDEVHLAGKLRVRRYNGTRHTHSYDISPSMDRLVVFPSHPVLHEVLANYAERYAITVWLHA